MDRAPAAPRLSLAWLFTLLIALWILLGASFKLLWGTPADLPPVLFELGLAKATTYKLAIAAELVIVSCALLKPSWGWVLCAAALLVFDLILTTQLAAGADSCGCFGGKLSMPPWLMLVIDTLLLVGLLAGRPWRSLAWPDLGWLPTALLASAAASLPYLLDRSVELTPPLQRNPPAAAQPDTGATAEPSAPLQAAPAPAAPDTQAEAPTQTPAEPKSGLRGYVDFDPPSWVGRGIDETPLASLMDVWAYDQSCTWILWRWTCEHCAEHFEQLAASYDGSTPLVLVRLREPQDNDSNRVVQLLPQGPLVLQAELPDSLDYLATTPVILHLEAGVVRSVE